jgi:3-hydroxyisobutyrate dehydrogenase
MGGAIWRRLHDQDVDAIVVDASGDATAALAAEGATIAADPASLAGRAGVVLLSLPTSAEVEEVALGTRGLASAMAPGTLVVDLTSGLPSASRRIAGRLADAGVRYIDVGVSGGVEGARAGTLKAMIGGAEEDVRAARHVLELIVTRSWHCGAVGAGHLVKTLLNQSNQAKLMVELEALLVAARAGLDPVIVADVLDASVWSYWLFDPSGRRTVGFALSLACKDFDIALQTATETRVAVPLAAMAQQMARLALADAGSDADLIDAVAVWERLAGVKLVPTEGGAS